MNSRILIRSGKKKKRVVHMKSLCLWEWKNDNDTYTYILNHQRLNHDKYQRETVVKSAQHHILFRERLNYEEESCTRFRLGTRKSYPEIAIMITIYRHGTLFGKFCKNYVLGSWYLMMWTTIVSGRLIWKVPNDITSAQWWRLSSDDSSMTYT